MKTPMVAFVGPHNSGKTGLVERLGGLAAGAGITVGIIKRAARPLVFDRSGKDSARLAQSGAVRVVTAAPGMLYVQESLPEPETITRLARRFGGGIQLWLVESYTPERVPWLRVGRPGQRVPDVDAHCIGTVGQRSAERTVPHFRIDRPRAVLDYITGRAGSRGLNG